MALQPMFDNRRLTLVDIFSDFVILKIQYRQIVDTFPANIVITLPIKKSNSRENRIEDSRTRLSLSAEYQTKGDAQKYG